MHHVTIPFGSLFNHSSRSLHHVLVKFVHLREDTHDRIADATLTPAMTITTVGSEYSQL